MGLSAVLLKPKGIVNRCCTDHQQGNKPPYTQSKYLGEELDYDERKTYRRALCHFDFENAESLDFPIPVINPVRQCVHVPSSASTVPASMRILTFHLVNAVMPESSEGGKAFFNHDTGTKSTTPAYRQLCYTLGLAM